MKIPTTLRINGVVYDKGMVVDEIEKSPLPWQLAGLNFLRNVWDNSISNFDFHTSGTTGPPKQIFFPRDQIFYSAKNTCAYFGLDSNSTLMLCLPTEFVAGKMMLARALFCSGSLIWIEPSLNPLLKMDDNQMISFAAFTPSQVLEIIKNDTSLRRFKNIDTVIIGGGAISPELENTLQGLSSNIFATYGMTETLTHIAVRRIGEPVYHSIDDEMVLSKDNRDCLVINLNELNEEPIVTNDVVEIKEDGKSFIWKGRVDDIINSGGLKINPLDIEEQISKHGLLPGGDFYITSAKDEQFGEVPVLILPNKYSGMDVEQLKLRINNVLNKHHRVKAVHIIGKFEYTSTGKLIRIKW